MVRPALPEIYKSLSSACAVDRAMGKLKIKDRVKRESAIIPFHLEEEPAVNQVSYIGIVIESDNMPTYYLSAGGFAMHYHYQCDVGICPLYQPEPLPLFCSLETS